MPTLLNPYLSFKDNAREAMKFYHSVFGGELTTSSFTELPDSDPADADKLMHSQLETDGGLVLMASDTATGMDAPGPNGAISISGNDEGELRGYWDKLSADGTVILPLEKAPWGDSFGMTADKFGVTWMVNISIPG